MLYCFFLCSTEKFPPKWGVFIRKTDHAHEFRAATTAASSPYAFLLAKEAVRLIAAYLPVALEKPDDLEARYGLLYASALAGISLDCALAHLTHALAHTISAYNPEIAHGLGLGVLQPAVLKAIYPAAPKTLAEGCRR